MRAVLDASALLAYLRSEPGSEQVEALLEDSAISSVNWLEVVQRCIAGGVMCDGMREDLGALGLKVLPFTPEAAETAGRLWQRTRPYGLSLGDRACLSVAMELGVPAVTTDQAWAGLNLPIIVQVIR